MRSGATVAVALLLDALFGEPPERLHPTVWMGWAIASYERRALELEGFQWRTLAGAALALGLPALVFGATHALLSLVPGRLRWPLEVGLLSTALSMRGLARSAMAVEAELGGGNLEAARARVGELVGRDTQALPAGEVARAVVESVAENTSDGIIAPMFYGYLLGAPGALCYKAVNTLDSMVGHPEPPHRELGWAPARLDDLANLVSARLGVLLAAAASGRLVITLKMARRYGPLTRSPNAGWVEAAFAGALGLRLGGTNSYGGEVRPGPILGDGRPPAGEDIRRAVVLMRRCCVILAVAVIALDGLRRG